MTLDEVRAQLEAHGQGHVLRFYETLTHDEQKALLENVSRIDLEWLDGAVESELEANDPSSVEPYRAVVRADDARADEARQAGIAALEAGKVGVLLVAGGAGTRLGFDGPKGAFPIAPLSQKTLFQLHVERLVAIGKRYGKVPPLYLMTSPANHEQTCAFFAEHQNFGLPADRLLIFPQGMAPAVDSDGKLLLAEKHQLVMAPNGNGGLFAAMRDGGAFEHMKQNGVEAISYIQVDNALADATDALFLGFHMLDGCDFSCKACPKVGPSEKVGNYALAKGRLAIVEYYEIPDELAEKRDESGELLFNWGNPGLFVWSVAFAEVQAHRKDLPVHKAHKKIPHINEAGQAVCPRRPTATSSRRLRSTRCWSPKSRWSLPAIGTPSSRPSKTNAASIAPTAPKR
jgi:UDP-N-acetylglucosamine/UDP-N-acetylgalactosamine diphosphorylase